MTPARIVLVTDPAFGDDWIVRCVREVARALPRGALCVQLRDKRRARASLRVFAGGLRAVTRGVGATLVVNGEPALARDVGADGVHLASGGLSVAAARAIVGAAWISVAAHDDGDVRRAVADGADAVLVSPVFASRPPGISAASKEGRGLGAIAAASAIARGLRVFALGGIDEHNARRCVEAGAHGVAVMKALLASDSPARVARAIHDAVEPRW
jgi:thiamine-phosphate pyrophosphorylase